MKTKQLIYSLVLGISLLAAQIELKTLSWTCEGKAEIVSDNLAQAQAQALIDAFKQAISNALREALGEKLFQEKAKAIENYFFKDPAQFVDRYKILSQEAVEKNYIMEVEVELSATQMQIGLIQAGFLPTRSKNLLLTVIQEEKGNLKSSWLEGSGTESLPEKILSRELKSWGYRLVNPEPIFDPKKMEQNLSDPNWLSKLRAKFGADLFLFGKLKIQTEFKGKAIPGKTDLEAIEESEEAGRDIYTAKAELELWVIDLTGQEKKLNLKTEQTATVPGMDQARTRSVEMATGALLPELSLALERLTQRGISQGGIHREIIEITGLLSYYQYQQLVAGLKKVEAIRELELWGFAPGSARFWANYSGDRESFKKALASVRFPEFRLLPMESEPETLRFKFEELP